MSLTFSEPQMYYELSKMLFPGENIKYAVTCCFRQTGFFADNRVTYPGFVGCTDRDRILFAKYYLLKGFEYMAFDLPTVMEIKIKNTIVFKQTVVEAVFPTNQKAIRVKFQIAPKVLGSKFPYQTENLELLIADLNKYM